MTTFLQWLCARLMNKSMRRHSRSAEPMAIFAWDYVGLRVMIEGTYEGDFLNAVLEFFKRNSVRTTGTYLDIGANIGNHAVYFARHGNRVIAFEPNPRVYRLLALNAEGKAIETHNYGLSDQDATVQFEEYLGNLGESRVVKNAIDGRSYSSIVVRKYDDIDLFKNVHIDVMKVDVEFHEFEVFSGCEAMLRACKPALIFEQMADEIQGGSSRTLDLIRSHGYEIYYFGNSIDFPRGIRGIGSVLAALVGDKQKFRRLRKLKKKAYNLVALPARPAG